MGLAERMRGLFGRPKAEEPKEMSKKPPAETGEKVEQTGEFGPEIEEKDIPEIEVDLEERETGGPGFGLEGAKSEKGAKEKAQGGSEDRSFFDEKRKVAGVFDGLGGQKGGGGEVAAQIAMESIMKSFKPGEGEPVYSKQEAEALITQALSAADEEIVNSGASLIHPEMATTASVIAFYKDRDSGKDMALLGQVGDSKAYRLRQGKLELISPDDSPVAFFQDFGVKVDTSDLNRNFIDAIDKKSLSSALAGKTEKDIAEINMALNAFQGKTIGELRNITLSSLGGGEKAVRTKPRVDSVEVEDGDLFILTTDGMTDNYEDKEIEDRIVKGKKGKTGLTIPGSSLADKNTDEISRALVDFGVAGQSGERRNKVDDISIITIRAKVKKAAEKPAAQVAA